MYVRVKLQEREREKERERKFISSDAWPSQKFVDVLLRVYSRVIKIFVIALTSRISAGDSIVMGERMRN